jgi:hypothetical protein
VRLAEDVNDISAGELDMVWGDGNGDGILRGRSWERSSESMGFWCCRDASCTGLDACITLLFMLLSRCEKGTHR